MQNNSPILLDQTTSEVISSKVEIASSFLKRLCGLIFYKKLEPGQSMFIPGCRQVHMFFMKFPIDLVFCNQNLQVVDIQENLQPWSLSPLVLSAQSVIELPAGTIKNKGIRITHQLILK